MDRLKITITFIILSFCVEETFSQNNAKAKYPKVGHPCPDFVLSDVHFYAQNKIGLQDLKGKFVILDFWTRYCSSCIKTFPKVNQLQENFKDKLQIFLVGLEDDHIRQLYEGLRSRFHLDLPSAYSSVLFKSFAIPSVPHLIWIDNNGVVQAVTSSEYLTERNISSFVNGVMLDLPQKLNAKDEEGNSNVFNINKPFLVDGNGGSDTSYLYRSVLAKWNKKLPLIRSNHFMVSPNRPNEIFISGADLGLLYMMAFGDTVTLLPLREPNNYHTSWPTPLLELEDSSEFIFNYVTEENLYCYNLTVPSGKAAKLKMQKIMQNDLKYYFDYEVSVEQRKMPYWKITTQKDYEKLKTKGGKSSIGGNGIIEVTLSNQPLSSLVRILWSQNQSGPPIVDRTGIPWNIDLTISALISNLNDVKASLLKAGLNLIEDEMEMKVIVIKSPK